MQISGSQVNSGKKRCTSSCPRTLERKVGSMEYDNIRDSKSHGADWGVIIEGSVVHDVDKGEFVLLDDEGKAFSTQEFLKAHAGKTVRFTCIDMESAEKMEQMLKDLQVQQGGG